MKDYIVCERRVNLSRIHVKICQLRCKEANICEAFQDHLRTDAPGDVVAGAAATELSAEKGLTAPSL
jgi:hypothetical protein